MQITLGQLRKLLSEKSDVHGNQHGAVEALKLLRAEGINWLPSQVRYAPDDGYAPDEGWILVNEEEGEAYSVNPETEFFEPIDYVDAMTYVADYESKYNKDTRLSGTGKINATKQESRHLGEGRPMPKYVNSAMSALRLLNDRGIRWLPSQVRVAADTGGTRVAWLLANTETNEAYMVFPKEDDFEEVDFKRAMKEIERWGRETGNSTHVTSRGNEDKPTTPKGVWEGRLNEETGNSESLEHMLKFAGVFANLPRPVRLDVMRMVSGEDLDKINDENLRKALHVLGEIDPELDEKFMDYFDNNGVHEGSDCMDETAPPGGEKVVKALKKQKGVKNPYAVAWSMKNKGDKFKG